MENEKAVEKYIRFGFAISCVFNSVLLLLGGFYLAVDEFFPIISEKLSIGVDLTTADFPPIDIILLPFNFLFELYLLAIYGVLPLLFCGAGLLRNVYNKLFIYKNAEVSDIYKQVKSTTHIDFAVILLNIALSFGFSALGIYPKIHTYVNILMAVVLCVLIFARPRIPKPETIENTEEHEQS